MGLSEFDAIQSKMEAMRAEMVKAKLTNKRYDTLSEALSIIDPQGRLEPGTPLHNFVTETILSWMDELEPDEVMRKSEIARPIFSYRRLMWQ